MEIEWDWDELINDSFKPLIEDQSRYLILVGGRGSSKSDFAAKKLILRCIQDKYFRQILIRKTYRTIKDSQFQTIKDIIIEMGLDPLFKFIEHPYKITCVNGNMFIAAGMDEPKKIKSVKDPTGIWWEEEIPDEPEFITVTTSVRTLKANYLQEIFTINPEVSGSYQEHYFYKMFFKGKPKEHSGYVEVKLEGEIVKLSYRVHHSTHKDNIWLPVEFRAYLESLKDTNPYYYKVFTLGEWGTVEGTVFRESVHWELTDYWPDSPKWTIYGLDFGYTNHPTALIELAYWDQVIYVRQHIYETRLTNSDIANIVHEKGIKGLVIADSAEPKSIEDLWRQGVTIEGAVKGPDSIKHGIDLIKQNYLGVHTSAGDVINELRSYAYKSGTTASALKNINAPIDKWNHAIDALRYALTYKLGSVGQGVRAYGVARN